MMFVIMVILFIKNWFITLRYITKAAQAILLTMGETVNYISTTKTCQNPLVQEYGLGSNNRPIQICGWDDTVHIQIVIMLTCPYKEDPFHPTFI